MTPPPDPKTRLRRLPPTLCTRNHIPATSCSKTPRGLLAPLGVPGLFVQVKWVHRAPGGDSGEVIGPFMHVGTYPTRHLAHICYFPDLKEKRGGLALRQPPCIATGVGLYLNRACAISGVESLRILDTAVLHVCSFAKPSLRYWLVLSHPSVLFLPWC